MTVKVFFTLPEEAKAIRARVFLQEQGFEEEFDDTDNISKHIIVYDGDRAIGTCRVYCDEGGEYHIGRICVEKDYRGRGIGSVLVKEGERVIRDCGAKLVTLSAQTRVIPFYQSLGFEPVGEEYYEEFCPHRKMIKRIDKD